MVLSVGVPHASLVEKLETVVGQVVSNATKARDVLCATSSGAVVPAIVLAATVVEDGEETNNRDTAPVRVTRRSPWRSTRRPRSGP